MSQLKWVTAASAVLAVTGCGGPTTPSATVTVTAPATTTAPQATTAEPAPDVETCTVPNVVGMIHQTAQDTMQAAGLYRLREQDATGQGRVLALDRNWTTTAQTPAAGQVVPCDTEVLLSAKKNDE